MTTATSIQVLSVDSNEEGRLALRKYLAEIEGLVIAAEAGSAQEALQHLRDKTIDVVLIDLGARHVNGIELIRQIRQAHPSVRVLIFTASDTPEDIFSAMDGGADGYVLKGNLAKSLEIAIRSVKLGTVWLDPGIARQVLEVMVTSTTGSERMLQTGFMRMPLMPNERAILDEVAGSNCVDGVCMVDPSFVKKLRRFAPSSTK
jgi:DNA-binding NarL/FixJ family response regulator